MRASRTTSQSRQASRASRRRLAAPEIPPLASIDWPASLRRAGLGLASRLCTLFCTLFCTFGYLSTGAASPLAADYATYGATLTTVSNLPRARTTQQGGWTVIEVPATDGVASWSFTPPEHPAHPSAVRRRLRFTDQDSLIDTDLLCEASAQQCALLSGQLRGIQQQLGTAP